MTFQRFYAAEICLGIEFLHENGILSRNIKLDNIGIASDGHVKITEFRFAKEGMKGLKITSTFCGTPEFMAPEVSRIQHSPML